MTCGLPPSIMTRQSKTAVHPFRTSKCTGTAAGENLAQCNELQLSGVNTLAQQVHTLLGNRTEAPVASFFHRCPREGVLFIGE